MSEFGIEKGVEMPRSKKATIYPFEQMEVGDSFFIETDDPRRKQNSLRGCCRNSQHRYPGRVYATRVVPGGVRCWRTA